MSSKALLVPAWLHLMTGPRLATENLTPEMAVAADLVVVVVSAVAAGLVAAMVAVAVEEVAATEMGMVVVASS